jgi:hypothetical protein
MLGGVGYRTAQPRDPPAITLLKQHAARRSSVQNCSLYFQTRPLRPVVAAALKNHGGKGVEIVGEARPARWKLKETANWRRPLGVTPLHRNDPGGGAEVVPVSVAPMRRVRRSPTITNGRATSVQIRTAPRGTLVHTRNFCSGPENYRNGQLGRTYSR